MVIFDSGLLFGGHPVDIMSTFESLLLFTCMVYLWSVSRAWPVLLLGLN